MPAGFGSDPSRVKLSAAFPLLLYTFLFSLESGPNSPLSLKMGTCSETADFSALLLCDRVSKRGQRWVRGGGRGTDSSGIPTLASMLAAPGAQNPDPRWRLGLVALVTSLWEGVITQQPLSVVSLYKQNQKKKLLHIMGLGWGWAGNAFVLGDTRPLVTVTAV